MKTKLKLLPYLLVNIIAFYLLPIMIKDSGRGILIMLFVIPAICFVTSVIFGVRHSFELLYSLSVALLFVPTIFIFYNPSAWVYILMYGVIALIGNFMGDLLSKSVK